MAQMLGSLSNTGNTLTCSWPFAQPQLRQAFWEWTNTRKAVCFLSFSCRFLNKYTTLWFSWGIIPDLKQDLKLTQLFCSDFKILSLSFSCHFISSFFAGCILQNTLVWKTDNLCMFSQLGILRGDWNNLMFENCLCG